MDVRMPDGTVVTNVPENITKAELLAKYNGTQFTGTIPEGVDIRDFNINQAAEGLDQPYVPPTPEPRPFKEKLFGKEGAKLAPGAEPLKYAYENPDVVAATAASLAVPPLAVPGALSKLGLAGKAVAPLVKHAPQVSAAAGAGGGGGVVKEALNNPEATLDSLIEQGVRSAAEMGTAEAAGIAGVGLLSKVLAPGAKTLTEQGRKLIDFAREHKLPLKPSAAAPSVTAKVLEGVTDSFLPSRIVKQFSDKKIANVLSTSTPDANNLIAEVTKVYEKNSPGLDSTIRSAGKALETALAELTPRAEARYGAFTQAIGGRDRWTSYPKLREALEQIKSAESALAGGRDDVSVGFASNFLGKHVEQISADDLYKQYKRLSHLKGADKRNLGLLRDAFKEEFQDLAAETGDDALKLLKEANIEYALGKSLKDPRGVVKKIVEGKIPDNQVTVNLFRDTQYGTLKQIEGRIPKKTFENLQRLNLETLIQNSSVKSNENAFMSVVDGQKLLSWIDKNPKTFGMYPKETQEALKNFSLYAKFHRSEAVSGTKGFGELVEKTAIRTSLGGGAALAAGGIPGVVVSSVAAPALAYSMMRPNSVINKWLVRGEIGPFANGMNEGLKVGGRLVFQDSTD